MWAINAFPPVFCKTKNQHNHFMLLMLSTDSKDNHRLESSGNIMRVL